MATVKKVKKATPYDPYQPYGNHSLPWYQQQANLRAANDTTAQVAALPSSQFYTDSAAQLAQALAGIQGNQAGIASAGGDLYQQAYQNASAPVNKAVIAAGGTPTTGPVNSSLVGALGATMAQALSGGQSAAVARGRNDVIARAGQETAIRAKQPSAAAAYLKEMTDNALQARVAMANEMMARNQFNLDASNVSADNQFQQDQLAAQMAGDSAAAGAKSSATLAKDMAAARKAAADARKGVASTTTTGNDYTYNVPNSVISDDPTASGTTPHVIRAANGPAAQAAFHAWIKNLPGFDPAVNANSFYSGTFKPVTSTSTTPGSRTAQLHAALNYFLDARYPRATALKYARQIIGSKVGKKKNTSGQKATDSIESHR